MQTYLVYYDLSGHNMENEVVQSRAHNVTMHPGINELAGLEACEMYLFRAQVQAKEGLGPLSTITVQAHLLVRNGFQVFYLRLIISCSNMNNLSCGYQTHPDLSCINVHNIHGFS